MLICMKHKRSIIFKGDSRKFDRTSLWLFDFLYKVIYLLSKKSLIITYNENSLFILVMI